MGIPGLTTLVNKKKKFPEELFGGRWLVIDGSNLVYHLYFDSGLDQTHGGEYGAFEDLVKQFFSALRVCDITPYVVFDGCSDLSDKKLETEMARAQKRVQNAHNAAVNNQQLGVLPALIWEVFRQTLEALTVKRCRSYTEADREAAALAHQWGCPVLSNDSDFFIFPSSGGMLPTAHFRWRQVQQSGSHSFIPCKKFDSSRVCQILDIQPQFLPVFAVLVGNDYVRTAVGAQYGRDRLEQLLQWIRNLTVNETQDVFKEALKDVSLENKEEQLEDLLQGALHYSLPQSTLSGFFDEGNLPPLPPRMESVPDWMRLPVTEARFSSDYLDILVMQRNSLGVVVDHKDKPSANLVSRPLRRVLYALLLGGTSSVEERDREGLKLTNTRVEPATSVPPEINIQTLHQAEEAQRLQVLLDALGVNRDCLSSLPPHLTHLSLPLAATCYWLQKATPPSHLLEALLIGWLKGDTHKAAQDPDSKQPLNLDWCHWLNQWQSCLKESYLLNQLLGQPLLDPPLARLYNGTLMYVLLHKMKSQQLDDFVNIRSDLDYQALLNFTKNTQGNPGVETSLTSDRRLGSSLQQLDTAPQKRMRK